MVHTRRLGCVFLLVFLGSGLPGFAQSEPEQNDPTSTQQTIAALQRQVDLLTRQLAQVQEQLDALRQQQEDAAREAEREQLRRAAEAQARETAEDVETVDTTTTFGSGTRMQAQLNPEISVTGDLWLVGGNHQHEELQERGVELDMQSYLDPFTRMHVVLGHHGSYRASTFGIEPHHHGDGHDHEGEEEEHEHEHGGVEVGEAYMTWMQLPGSLSFTLGKKRQQFGVLNRWHIHALDQVDMPWVLGESFGDHGLSGLGVSLDWVMPRLWADANELTVEVTNGDNDRAFAGSDWERPTFLARLKNYWDLTASSYFELGLNALHGAADPDGHLSNDFYAVDLTFNWYPAGRELYRDFTLRGMVLRSQRELEPGLEHEAWGGYLYGQFKFSRWWIAGVRYDWVDDQFEDGHREWGLSPYLTFWQSEFVRLRAQYSLREDNLWGSDRRFVFQATFAAGPHKHESY